MEIRLIGFKSSLLTPYVSNLNMISLYQLLSKAFKITSLTSIVGTQSKEELILWTIDSNCEMQESPGKNPDHHFVKTWFLWK